MSAHTSDGCRFVCHCGSAYQDLAGLIGHYGSLHAPVGVVPDTHQRNSQATIADGLALVADGATVAEAAEAVGLARGTLQWHVSKRGGAGAVREAVTP